MKKEEFDKVYVGRRVGFVCGPGESPAHNPGTVTAKVEDRWGFHLEVCEDNGNEVSVEGLVARGIGCYLLGEGESEKDE